MYRLWRRLSVIKTFAICVLNFILLGHREASSIRKRVISMFWIKKKHSEDIPSSPEQSTGQSERDTLEATAMRLAASLKAYSDAANHYYESEPSLELESARAKVAAARSLVQEGGLAYALGRCIPRHVKHWPAWIRRSDFDQWVGFDASEIKADRTDELDGEKKIITDTVCFMFRGTRYRLILRDKGLSLCPDDASVLGELEFFINGDRVAEFELVENLKRDFSEWEFADVRALKVGPWMKEVLDMAAQIEANTRHTIQNFSDERTMKAARDIDLG